MLVKLPCVSPREALGPVSSDMKAVQRYEEDNELASRPIFRTAEPQRDQLGIVGPLDKV